MPTTKDKEFVLRAAQEQNVKFVRLWFTDILGFLKSFAITADDLEEALEEGVAFDGASIEGFARVDESDMIAMPDPSTFQVIPWRPRENGAVARMFCDILEPTGRPNVGDPRYVLKRNLTRAARMGFTYYVSPEIEFFYFKPSDSGLAASTIGLDRGGYFDLTPLDMASDLRRETVLTLEEMGIGVETSHHEVAPSQQEIDLRYADALTMADSVMTYRLVVKEVALKNGVHASFMPKPVSGQAGNGMHVNQSLFRGERNAFYNPRDRWGLSSIAKRFIAGLLRHAPEFTLVTNQWVNSYKRLVPGYEAPVYVSWARLNRSDLIRVPACKPGQGQATRVEIRSPDPACNPYLAFSVLLAAGLEGIEKGYDLPPPVEKNVLDMTPQERARRGIVQLPEDLWEAIRLAEQSAFLRRVLGEHVLTKFIQNKKIEWESYRAHVSGWEMERYLPIL